MIERGRRLILWLAAAAISIPLIFEGHGVSREGDAVSFLPCAVSDPGGVTIRLRGDVDYPGVYRFPAGAGVESVTKMTLSSSLMPLPRKYGSLPPLRSGEVVEILAKNGNRVEIARENMGVEEKVILGIPLELNRMTETDWEYLPGIGAMTARKLAEDRHKNGDFASLNDLRRVPGMGRTRLKQIERFFPNP